MKSAVVAVVLGVVGVSLAGCGSTMRNYLEKDTPGESAALRQDLTMPPDLRLPPPGTTAAAPDPGAGRTRQAMLQPSRAATVPSSAAANPIYGDGATAAIPANSPDSIYIQAGISVYKPDGTRKSDVELRRELQQYYVAKKRAQNPNYGTIFNIGNIFKDE